MTEPVFTQDQRDKYESVFGIQPEWHAGVGEPASTPPDLTDAKPGATPQDAETEDDALYYSLYGK